MKLHERCGSGEPGGGRSAPARVAALALGALAGAWAIAGCGGQGGTGDATGQSVVVQPPQSQSVAAQAASALPASGDAPLIAAGESLPPDVIASVEDTLVSPGESVEITARGTADVTQMALWDGIHDRQAFAFDSTANVWQVTYRVPLRPAFERVGLSVTAKNDAERWRRVWIFLRVEQPETAAAPESQP